MMQWKKQYPLVLFGKNIKNLVENLLILKKKKKKKLRVSNSASINSIRSEIEIQCGNEELFPKEFIFLRSVGRAMTRVKEKQEYELKVKNFRPPQVINFFFFYLIFLKFLFNRHMRLKYFY